MQKTIAIMILAAGCNDNTTAAVSGTGTDAGRIVSTTDGGPPSSSKDGGLTATNATWGATDGLTEPIIDVSTDEAGNVWAIGSDTLYLRKPGATSFISFGTADGIHIQPFTGPTGEPDVTTLTAVAGAGANELYLGYHGYESDDPFDDTEAEKELGNGDHIRFDPSTNKISVLRYQFHCIVEGSKCWEDRSVRRLVVGHAGPAAGHAFFGFNHGTTHVFDDVLGDHIHPEINWVAADGTIETRYGECRALALDPDGELWVGNRCGVGRMNWNADPIAWVSAKFNIAFTTYTSDHGLNVPTGYVEDNEGAAVTSDGTVWLASGTYGMSSFDPTQDVSAIKHWSTLPLKMVDVVADTDDTLWIVEDGGQLDHFTPSTGVLEKTDITDATRLYLDRVVSPRVLYVGRASGVTVDAGGSTSITSSP